MINGQQCHAARALIDLNREQLAKISGLPKDLITNFERKLASLNKSQLKQLQESLEQMGAIFIHEDSGGFGVRLKFAIDDAHQVAQMEDEGGAIVANDILL